MHSPLAHLHTSMPGITWPRFATDSDNAVLAILYQLDQGQRLPETYHQQQQLMQASQLVSFAWRTVPFYQERLKPFIGTSPLTMQQWREIPLLTRQAVQEAGNELMCRKVPPRHAELTKISTSGSTGMPVTCYSTRVTRFMYTVNLCREHLWHQRDFSAKHLAIRPDRQIAPGELKATPHWGGGMMNSGPSQILNVRTDIHQQLEILHTQNPGYLLSLPSNLKALAQLCRSQHIQLPGLREVRCYGEILPRGTRQLLADTWNVPISDVYSSQELGMIAAECPECRKLHVMNESILLEVLDDRGQPCNVGETGKVVVTSLLNYGYPLIRYVLGDYARVGAPCACGRTLPVLDQVLGRQRNMLLLPGGGQLWPSFAVREWAQDLPLTQFQFVQTALDRIEARLVCQRPLTGDEEQRLIQSLHQRLTYPFQIDLRYLDRIERSVSGKYEDFLSQL